MGQDNQYKTDIKRLAELIGKYTGIPKSKTAAFLEENGASKLFQCSYSLVKTDEQFQKLASLFEFMRLYENLYHNDKNHVINSSETARDYFIGFYADKSVKEYFSAAFLDPAGVLLKTKILSEGTIDEAAVYPREVVREALFSNASSVILSHNHPGHTARPSDADLEATQEIAKSLNAVDIPLDDHILVVDRSKAISFAESGIDLGYKNNRFWVSERDGAHRYRETEKAPTRLYTYEDDNTEDEEMEEMEW